MLIKLSELDMKLVELEQLVAICFLMGVGGGANCYLGSKFI